jgi:hypothetical protein
VQFLTIRLFFETEHNVLIRREHLTDKIWKVVGLEREYETGNNDFDKSYFLDVKAKYSEALVRSVEFQNAITGLEPFTTVRIRPSGLGWSQEIRRKAQLEHITVGQYANRLLDLVRFLKRLEWS